MTPPAYRRGLATIREKRPGVWEVRAFTGSDVRGRPTQLSRTVHGGKRDAQRLAAQLESSGGQAKPAGEAESVCVGGVRFVSRFAGVMISGRRAEPSSDHGRVQLWRSTLARNRCIPDDGLSWGNSVPFRT